MAQSKALLRFRARLRSRGYRDIKIKRAHDVTGELAFDNDGYPLWCVNCTEPLMGYRAILCATENQMDNWPDIIIDGNGYFSLQYSMFDQDKYPAGFIMTDEEGGEAIFV